MATESDRERQDPQKSILNELRMYLRNNGESVERIVPIELPDPVNASNIRLMPAVELQFILAADQETETTEDSVYRPVYLLRGTVMPPDLPEVSPEYLIFNRQNEANPGRSIAVTSAQENVYRGFFSTHTSRVLNRSQHPLKLFEAVHHVLRESEPLRL